MQSEARAPSDGYTRIVLIIILSEACATSEARAWAVGGFAPKEALPFLLEALPWLSSQ